MTGPEKRDTSRGTLALFVATGLNRALSLFLLPLYTAVLGSSAYGIVAFGTSVQAFLAILMGLSFPSYVGREVVRARNDVAAQAAALSTGLAFVACFAILIGVSSLAPVQALLPQDVPNEFSPRFFAGALVVFALMRALLQVFSAFSLGLRRRFEVAKAECLEHFSRHSLLVTLSVLGILSASTYFVMCALAALLSMVLYATYYRRFLNARSVQGSRVVPGVRFSAPLAAHSLAYNTLHYVDRIILAWFIPIALLGVYHLAYTLVFSPFVLVQVLMRSWVPRVQAALEHGDAGPYRAFCFTIARTSLALAFGVSAFAPFLYQSVFEASYTPRPLLIPILAAGELLYIAYWIAMPPLAYFARHSRIPLITLTAVAVNVSALFILVPRLAEIGAAVATLVGLGILGAGVVWLNRSARILGAVPARPVSELALGSLLMVVGSLHEAGTFALAAVGLGAALATIVPLREFLRGPEYSDSEKEQ